MEYSHLTDVVRASITESNNHNFLVTLQNGTKERKRLFISVDGLVCEFNKRSRTRGRFVMFVNDWLEVKPIVGNTDKVRICKRSTKQIIKYLSASGLWPVILENMMKLQQLNDNELEHLLLCEYDELRTYLESRGIEHISVDMFHSLISDRAVRTVNWGDNDWIKQGYKNALNTKRDYSMRWTVQYDNSIEYKTEGNRAWYSEEFRGTGNGHYYLLLDEKHIAFREDD